MYLKEDIIQRIMHSSIRMKLWFSFSLVAIIFFCINVHSFHYVPCSLIVQSYIYTHKYIYIYMRERYIHSVLLMFLFYCWIKLLSELHLPLVINYCNGLGQWSYSQSKFVFPVSLFCHLSQFLIKKKKYIDSI